MPFLAAPLIAAGVSAIGSAVGSAVSSENARASQAQQTQAADKARQQAMSTAQQAINSQDAQNTRGIEQQQSQAAQNLLTPDVYQNQAGLVDALKQQAAGQGPNPALAQLANTTGANVANQASLMAGQRGAGANAGLIARQAAQQGGALNQQAAGQAAVLRANQQLAGQQQLQEALRSQIGAGLQAQQGAASTALGNQSITTNALTGAAGQGNAANLQAMQTNAGFQNQANQYGQQAFGAGLNAAGSAISALAGGGGNTAASPAPTAASTGPTLGAVPIAPSGGNIFGVQTNFAQGGIIESIGKENYKGKSKIGGLLMAEGGKVHNMKRGGHVPGKAKVSGARDSYANDTVDAKLSPGEIVLPRSVTMSKNPEEAAAKFVAALKAKKGK